MWQFGQMMLELADSSKPPGHCEITPSQEFALELEQNLEHTDAEGH